MRSQKFARTGAAVASLLLLASACSSDRGEADPAPEGEETTATAQSAELPTDTFGDLPNPCGDGDASGSTDKGVTDDAITIGYGDDRGYAATPGLNQEMGDAMDALIQWCNDQGGINGRQIKGNRYDAAIFESASVIKEACGQDFMLVGQGFALDENMEADRVGCQLPSVAGFTLSGAASMGPMHFQGLPGPSDIYSDATQEILVDNYPAFEKVDFLKSDSAAVALGQKRYEGTFAELGNPVQDCGVTAKSTGGDNYRALVQKYKDCGATALFSVVPPSPPIYSFVDAMKVEGFDVPLATEATWYADAVRQANVNGLTEGILVGSSFQPFENADVVPAVGHYLAVMEQSDGQRGLLGMQSTSSFLLWATVAKECGSDLTRQCMVNGLSKVTSWTGGGLHAETNPGENRPQNCSMLLELQGEEYVQVQPAEQGEFYCSEDGPRKANPDEVGVELNDDRIATTYLTDDVITPKG